MPTGKSQAPLQLGEQKGKKDYDLKTRQGKQVLFAAMFLRVSTTLAGLVIC